MPSVRRSARFSGRQPTGLQVGLLTLLGLSGMPGFLAPAGAQVGGEILVGHTASSLVPTQAGAPTQAGIVDRPADDQSAAKVATPTAGSLTEPQPVLIPQPVYPRAARAARQEGRVVVCFTVDERGRVSTPAVRSSSDPVFNAPALEAIGASRFNPARYGKEPVRSTACRTFRFLLR